MASNQRSQLLIYVPENDRRDLKILAAEQDTSISAIMRQLIRQHLAEQKRHTTTAA